jgi:hypothetical protein
VRHVEFQISTGLRWPIKLNLQDPEIAARIKNGKKLKLSNNTSKT